MNFKKHFIHSVQNKYSYGISNTFQYMEALSIHLCLPVMKYWINILKNIRKNPLYKDIIKKITPCPPQKIAISKLLKVS